MMFKAAVVSCIIALAGTVSAAPFMKPQVVERDIQVLGVRHVAAQAPEAIAVRDVHYILEERQIPEEVPTKMKDGVLTPYVKREAAPIPLEIAVRTDEFGNIVPYGKRSEKSTPPAKRQIPAELAVKTDGNGNIVPYNKRSKETNESFMKRQIPAEVAVTTNERGEIVPYGRRA